MIIYLLDNISTNLRSSPSLNFERLNESVFSTFLTISLSQVQPDEEAALAAASVGDGDTVGNSSVRPVVRFVATAAPVTAAEAKASTTTTTTTEAASKQRRTVVRRLRNNNNKEQR